MGNCVLDGQNLVELGERVLTFVDDILRFQSRIKCCVCVIANVITVVVWGTSDDIDHSCEARSYENLISDPLTYRLERYDELYSW